VFATLLSRQATVTRVALAADVTLARPEVTSRLAVMRHALSARGLDPIAAAQGATRLLDGLVRQQSLLLSFEKLFLLAGILFVCTLPLLWFLRSERHAQRRAGTHPSLEAA